MNFYSESLSEAVSGLLLHYRGSAYNELVGELTSINAVASTINPFMALASDEAVKDVVTSLRSRLSDEDVNTLERLMAKVRMDAIDHCYRNEDYPTLSDMLTKVVLKQRPTEVPAVEEAEVRRRIEGNPLIEGLLLIYITAALTYIVPKV